VPCPFLVGDACSIYRHRPLACRRQISLANDSSPCRLQEQEDTDVPYLDRFDAKVAYVLAMGSHTAYADLREWFAARPSPKS
jgi:Fe-S-cluster containining protein